MQSVATIPASKLKLSAHDNDELIFVGKLYDELCIDDPGRAKDLIVGSENFVVATSSSNETEMLAVPEAYVNLVYKAVSDEYALENRFLDEVDTLGDKLSVNRIAEMRRDIHAKWLLIKSYVSKSTADWIDNEGAFEHLLHCFLGWGSLTEGSDAYCECEKILETL